MSQPDTGQKRKMLEDRIEHYSNYYKLTAIVGTVAGASLLFVPIILAFTFETPRFALEFLKDVQVLSIGGGILIFLVSFVGAYYYWRKGERLKKKLFEGRLEWE